jgi:hypothetical protein
MPTSENRSRGGQLGNLNALKHGFYTRHLKKRDLTGVESTDVKTLIEEIALLRVFIRRLIETLDPAADAYELASVLRILCVALKTITGAMKAQQWLTLSGSTQDDELRLALKNVCAEIRSRHSVGGQSSSEATSIPPTGAAS